MTMTAEEIVREYKQAKYPEKQIRILADQNSCGQSNIRAILEQAGCELPRAGRRKKASSPPESEGHITKFSLEAKEFETEDDSMKEDTAPLTVLPAPEGAGEFQDKAPILHVPGTVEQLAEGLESGLEAETDDTVPVSEALPLILRTSAVDVIARLLKDTRNSPESGAKFTEQVRGVLALVHEVETRSKEI